MNQNRLDRNDVNKKNMIQNESIDKIAIKDNISPIKLIEPGTLRLASINNTNIARSIKSNINIESIYLE